MVKYLLTISYGSAECSELMEDKKNLRLNIYFTKNSYLPTIICEKKAVYSNMDETNGHHYLCVSGWRTVTAKSIFEISEHCCSLMHRYNYALSLLHFAYLGRNT